MNYNGYRVKGDGIDLITDHFPITKEELASAEKKVNEMYGNKISGVASINRGKVFLGEYGVILGDFTYIQSTGQYEFHRNPKADEEIALKKEQDRRRRQNEYKRKKKLRDFILKKVTPFVLIATMSVAAVIGINNKKVDIDKTPSNEIVNVVGVKTINDSELEVVVEWLNYGIDGLRDTCYNSEWKDYVMPQYEDAYTSYFMPAMHAYSDYEEMVATELPDDIIGDSKEAAIRRVYSNANELNEVVPNSHQFAVSPYSKAIVVEMEDGTKEVYVPLSELKVTNYSTTNLPEDARIVDSQIYVLDDHLREVEKTLNQ